MTDPLNIISDDFSIWLLGYRIKLSCLYLPQGHYFISTMWVWSTYEYVFFFLNLSKNPPLNVKECMVKVIYNCDLFNEENHKVMYAGHVPILYSTVF